MAEDYVHSLGLPFLAHRLRRVAESIVEQTSFALADVGFPAPARSISTLTLLRDRGPLGVTEIASCLRVSHPLIIKLVAALMNAGLVSQVDDPADRRRRLIELTPAGISQAERAEAFSQVLARTFADIFRESGSNLFEALEAFEGAVERRPLAARLRPGFGGTRHFDNRVTTARSNRSNAEQELEKE
jgi:DNA-binding MarR family transcriptional regulator